MVKMAEPVEILNDWWNVEMAHMAKIWTWLGNSWRHVDSRACARITAILFVQVSKHVTFLEATRASPLTRQAKLTRNLPTTVTHTTPR